MSLADPNAQKPLVGLWVIGLIFVLFFVQNTLVLHDASRLALSGENEVQTGATVMSFLTAARLILSLVALYCVIKVRSPVSFWIIVITLIIGTPVIVWVIASLTYSMSPMVSHALLFSFDALLMDTIVVAALIYLFVSAQIRTRFEA